MSSTKYAIRVTVAANETQCEDAFHFHMEGADLPEIAEDVQTRLTKSKRKLKEFTVAAIPFEVDEKSFSDAELFAMSINQGTLFEGTTFGIYEGNLDGAD